MSSSLPTPVGVKDFIRVPSSESRVIVRALSLTANRDLAILTLELNIAVVIARANQKLRMRTALLQVRFAQVGSNSSAPIPDVLPISIDAAEPGMITLGLQSETNLS